MTDDRRARPRLATVICIYEGASVVLGVLSFCLLTFAARGINPSIAYYSTPLLQSVVMWVRYALALGAAIALWQMRRSAFYLLAGRVAIALILFLVSLLHSTPTIPTPSTNLFTPAIMHGVIRAISAVFLLLHAGVAWYVYNITSPQLPSSQASGPTALT